MSIFLQVFFPRMWEERCWRVSIEAKLLLQDVAASGGDQRLLDWIKTNHAFEYDGGVSGYVRPEKGGRPMRIALKRTLVENPDSCRTRFAAGHELGHILQLLQRQTQGSRFTMKLYGQEMDASAFAASVLERSRCRGMGWWYKSWLKHFLCAMEAAFPVVFHGVAGVVLWFVFVLLDRLTGIVNWLADRLAPQLALLGDFAYIQGRERV
jgi:hypothetical protein